MVESSNRVVIGTEYVSLAAIGPTTATLVPPALTDNSPTINGMSVVYQAVVMNGTATNGVDFINGSVSTAYSSYVLSEQAGVYSGPVVSINSSAANKNFYVDLTWNPQDGSSAPHYLGSLEVDVLPFPTYKSDFSEIYYNHSSLGNAWSQTYPNVEFYLPTATSVPQIALFGTSFPSPGKLNLGGDFDFGYYLWKNQDVAAALFSRENVDPALHYDLFGWREGRNPSVAFNTNYYLAQNPDVKAAGVDPLVHFEYFGWKEGRNPNAYFNVNFYLSKNPDVKATGIDPLYQYEHYGWKEGRDAGTGVAGGFDTLKYLADNPDVKAAGVNPLDHYLTFGIFEGRSFA